MKLIYFLVFLSFTFPNLGFSTTNCKQNFEFKKVDVLALYSLGLEYYYGIGVKKNYSASAFWIKKSAEQGFIPAQFFLAEMYLNGTGVEKDVKQAFYWKTESEIEYLDLD